MDWAVGSGREGKSYLLQVGGALFQSPLSWYSRRGVWDRSPGFAADKTLDFERPVTADCLFCHAGRAAPVAGSVNRYAEADPIPEPAITCARCHGPGEAHVRDARRGNIVNPVKLGPAQRDSVCEQCHLSGAARIPLPGKTFEAFRPGMALEEVFSVYLPVTAGQFKVVSHAEQLALSRCATASEGKMWCGSCHDAHREPADATRWYGARCASCHQQLRPHGDDCAGCHMPRTAAHDGGHTAFTDHRIRKPADAALPAGPATALRAWREPAPEWRMRGLGLAYAGAGEMEKAFGLLRAAPADPEVQTALGLIHLRSGRTEDGVRALRDAAQKEPGSATRHLNLAAALLAAGRREQARDEALLAIKLEPMLRDVYVLLAEIEPKRAVYWREQFERRWRK
jgi:hypothetical protein